MKKYFVCSDVHSFLTELKTALSQHNFDIDNPDHILVVCGDLFDRGDESLELFNFIKSLPEDRFIYIRGNHEDLLIECFNQIANSEVVSPYHESNGTLKTILDLSGLDQRYLRHLAYNPGSYFRGDVLDRIPEVIDYINRKCVDYVEIGDYILVHGWIPCMSDDLNPYHARKNMSYKADWRNATRGDWYVARWLNGMEAWHQGVKEPEKTIICGHFHASWGWSHLKQQRQEFPNKSKKDWQKSFEPFIDEGICAIDACTAYSGIVNIIILEV